MKKFVSVAVALCLLMCCVFLMSSCRLSAHKFLHEFDEIESIQIIRLHEVDSEFDFPDYEVLTEVDNTEGLMQELQRMVTRNYKYSKIFLPNPNNDANAIRIYYNNGDCEIIQSGIAVYKLYSDKSPGWYVVYEKYKTKEFETLIKKYL